MNNRVTALPGLPRHKAEEDTKEEELVGPLAGLMKMLQSRAAGNIEAMDEALQRFFARRPHMNERHLRYLYNFSLILEICGDARKREYMTRVMTEWQEHNMCRHTYDEGREDPGAGLLPDDDRQHLRNIIKTAHDEEEEKEDEEEEEEEDSALIMRLTRQNNRLKRKNKENRRTLQLRKKQRHEKLLQERMLKGRSDDIFNMFKRICATRDAPGDEEVEKVRPSPNYACIGKPYVATWCQEPWRLTSEQRAEACSAFDESDELFCSLYWAMVRNMDGYVEHLRDCIGDYENRRFMEEHVEVVCPTCNRKETVHRSHFRSSWSCKHCGFYFSAATASTEENASDDDATLSVMQEMRDTHEQEMNVESTMVNDMFMGCDYKTRQEYEFNRNANKLNHEKHRINFQNYLREYLHPNRDLIDERHFDLIRKEMELVNGRQPYDDWEDINITKLEQTLRRLNMKKRYAKNMFTLVWMLARNKPQLLTNNLFDVFMDTYRKLSVAFLEGRNEGKFWRKTMIRNCYVFERTCENNDIVCFRKFYRRVKCARSVDDHRVIYEWCCERAGLPYKPATN